MKPFVIHAKTHDLITGQYMIAYSFDIPGRPERSAITAFPNREEMEKYLVSVQRDWLLAHLEAFVNHKRIIIEAGRHPNQDEALKKCNAALDDFHAKNRPLKTICEQILKGRNHFHDIIPHPGNDSHSSSVTNLREITNFCENFLKA